MITSLRDCDESRTLEVLLKYAEEKGITRLANITHLDKLKIPVYVAVRPASKSLSTSQGKGVSDISAKCSALMESIEVSYAEDVSSEMDKKSTGDLKSCSYIDPSALSASVVYNNKQQKHDWVIGCTFLENKKVLIPLSHVSLDSTLESVLVYAPCSTGLSGGNSHEEALLHSLLENIERTPSSEKFIIKNFENTLLSQLNELNEVQLLFHVNKYHIPCFEVKLKAKSPFENQSIFVGKGCHLRKDIALNRALVEAAQSRLTAISGIREDIEENNYTFTNDFDIEAFTAIQINDVSDYKETNINMSIDIIKNKLKDKSEDALIYVYHHAEICVLKSTIISKDVIFD